MKPHALALVAAALTGILVGAAMVATKAVAIDVAPVPLAFLRYAIGLAFLLVPLLSVRWPRYAFKDAAAVALLGVFQFAAAPAFSRTGRRGLSRAVKSKWRSGPGGLSKSVCDDI